MSDTSKILWITAVDTDPDDMDDIAETLRDSLAADYDIIVSDERIELLDKDEILEALQ